MTHTNPLGFVEADSEMELTIHRRLRGATEGSTLDNIEIKIRESAVMVEPRQTLLEYERPQFTGDEFNVQTPMVAAHNFEIKASTIGMVHNSIQFDGLADEDPHAHLS